MRRLFFQYLPRVAMVAGIISLIASANFTISFAIIRDILLTDFPGELANIPAIDYWISAGITILKIFAGLFLLSATAFMAILLHGH